MIVTPAQNNFFSSITFTTGKSNMFKGLEISIAIICLGVVGFPLPVLAIG
jgi:hypothetical protein